jgi:phosphoacetylglucosamine mutase
MPSSSFLSQASAQETQTDFAYGTAGFRMNANLMPRVVFRIGILSALLSKKRLQAVGIMITASHNPECDNGVKIIEPNGEMLEEHWESYATSIVNCKLSELNSCIEGIVKQEQISLCEEGIVFVGRDGRKSGPSLASLAIEGCRQIAETVIVDYGLQTTPQLHFYVGSFNLRGRILPSEQDYYKEFVGAFCKFVKLCAKEQSKSTLIVDAANGIGAVKLKKVLQHLKGKILDVLIVNENGPLNEGCGADYVKLFQRAPKNLELVQGKRYCSVDGDVDRILYYYADENGKFRLLDGDKMAALFCVYLQELLQQADISCKLGIVQTAYSNGNCTSFLQSIGVKPEFACTGVKCLHHVAKSYNLAVYFEANGHGTVTSDEEFNQMLANATGKHAEKLRAFLSIVNAYVGDAITDLLLTEAILLDKKWNSKDWDALYTELPNKQTKLIVKDKKAFIATNADRQLIHPVEVQDFIDECTAKMPNARSFVRPSGTEDIVRLYVEAESEEACEKLTAEISSFIIDWQARLTAQ